MNGLYKAELIRTRGAWRSLEQIELATARVGRLVELHAPVRAIRDMPPAEFEALYYHQRAANEAA